MTSIFICRNQQSVSYKERNSWTLCGSNTQLTNGPSWGGGLCWFVSAIFVGADRSIGEKNCIMKPLTIQTNMSHK